MARGLPRQAAAATCHIRRWGGSQGPHRLAAGVPEMLPRTVPDTEASPANNPAYAVVCAHETGPAIGPSGARPLPVRTCWLLASRLTACYRPVKRSGAHPVRSMRPEP